MMIENLSINETLEKAKDFLKKEKKLSVATKAMMELLLLVIQILMQKLGVNSSNSSKPPAGDPNRKRGSKKNKSDRPSGGQKGHIGTTLEPVDNPDEIQWIPIDKRQLPRSHQYQEAGFQSRQVIDIKISRCVTEYRAQILVNEKGERYVASFPEGVTQRVQYGASVKVQAVYFSQFQLIPYERVQDCLREQMGLNVSQGSLFRFYQEAYRRLEPWDTKIVEILVKQILLHADETGIQIDKKRHWLHTVGNEKWTYFYPHAKRGCDAIEEMNIIPRFRGTLCHDHLASYFHYQHCLHSLCNAHHLRELTYAFEKDNQQWAQKMMDLLLTIKKAVENSFPKKLPLTETLPYFEAYQSILSEGEKECPLPLVPEGKSIKRVKKSKSRNLLERLKNDYRETLRFMNDPLVPFTNNPSENDLRMTKVQQKVSGCFRSEEGAQIFCRVRGYLSTCRKHGLAMFDALTLLFQGKLPDFIENG